MYFESIFLTEKDLWKLELSKELERTGAKETYIRSFADKINNNYILVKRTLEKLAVDFRELFGKEILKVEKNRFFFKSDGNLVSTYREYLIQESLPFQFVNEILSFKPLSVHEFCEKHGMSRSTFSNRISNLQDFCKLYNLKLNFTPIGVKGSELTIRLFLIFLHVIAFSRKKNYPYCDEAETLSFRTEISNVLGSETYMISSSYQNTFFYVIRRREEQGHYFTPSEKLLSFLGLEEGFLPIRFFENKQVAKNESAFVALLSHFSKVQRRLVDLITAGEDEDATHETDFQSIPRIQLIADSFYRYLSNIAFCEYGKVLPKELLKRQISYQFHMFHILDNHEVINSQSFIKTAALGQEKEIEGLTKASKSYFIRHKKDLKEIFPHLREQYFLERMQNLLIKVFLCMRDVNVFKVGVGLQTTDPYYYVLIKEIAKIDGVQVEFLSRQQNYDMIISSFPKEIDNKQCSYVYEWKDFFGVKEVKKLGRLIYEIQNMN
ncbi:Mga helix-turn-helix domain-containing protein [Pilibacter termitis]|uniref:Mga helix-turn-helix domain-containing protein n=1 Tax=Pilibacter termitis TaxID=263852 RepID=A0A1T4MWQ7_9ENTE|nr:helix-turn-helix domain-containing protein [Pilibacter termitis]SJZ71078.1 Mga helix-turn-helix domain-containing protein [Pilibacter termitis]